MKKNVLFLAFATLLSFQGFAQSDDESIKSTLQSYIQGFTKGDSASLNKAFHPNALLRNLNSTSGRIQDTPLKTFISKMPSGGVNASGKMLTYEYAGTSGVATVELQFVDFKYIDLLSLLKINDQWKIVCRIYSRVDLNTNLKGSSVNTAPSTSTPAKTPAKKNSANVKPKKDDGW
jgi:hypothetical protein